MSIHRQVAIPVVLMSEIEIVPAVRSKVLP